MEKQLKPIPDNERLKYHGTPEKPDIKIFVSHRIDLDSETVDNPLFIPVRCGAVFDERENAEILGDDTGDNISERRMSFCELTVQYWAWKNVKADYYGLCHYRRYLSFAKTKLKAAKSEHDAGCIVSPYITQNSINEFGLDEETMRTIIEKNDIVAFKPIDLGKCGMASVYKSMENSPKYHKMSDVDLAIKIISKKYPHMFNSAKRYFRGKNNYLYNCYIMKADIWNEYCDFLFDILFELEREMDVQNYSLTQLRGCGTIAERLWGVFLTYKKANKNLRIKEFPLVFFEKTEKNLQCRPVFDDNAVVMASNFNNKYFPIFTVFLTSILEHISSNRNYDYIIISYDISEENKKIIAAMIKNYPNFSVRYYDPSRNFEGHTFLIKDSCYTKDLYSRLIVPYVLKDYNKALVLDVDAICCCDIAEMYDISIDNYYMGGAIDVVHQGWLNGYVPERLAETKDILKLKEPYKYCNTGMIILNLKEIRDDYSEDFILNYIDSHHFRVYEQDTMNVLYQEKIKHINAKYNVYTYTNEGINECVTMAPLQYYKEYMEARNHPAIIHYAAHPKPWVNPLTDFATDFWQYARKSPLYEQIVFQITPNQIGVKGALVNWFKKHTPKWLRPFAKRVKRLLKW